MLQYYIFIYNITVKFMTIKGNFKIEWRIMWKTPPCKVIFTLFSDPHPQSGQYSTVETNNTAQQTRAPMRPLKNYIRSQTGKDDRQTYHRQNPDKRSIQSIHSQITRESSPAWYPPGNNPIIPTTKQWLGLPEKTKTKKLYLSGAPSLPSGIS